MTFNRSDVGAGSIFVAIGLFFGLMTLYGLDIGTARRMGPGYFPIVLSGILIVFGIATILKGMSHPDVERGPLPWRGIPVLLSVPVLFGLLIRPLGIAPVLLITTFVTSFASRRMSLLAAVALSVGLTIFCILVFSIGLGLPLRVFGSAVEPWTRPIFGVR
ncbi:tripartite tricarboxylate transporter TctB family protein [Aquamicrobium zhengzhouense]|uniref:Tripartite tricarboxylate transporter TctB family protein n=1 Tax=Aquamicrobium zhengzhouense TaxID=2781738 RepID=A0ABS0SDM9_9HYPH|nr:tripartite tricarboxylate transporter TctB family protein [Aquamicrobium zhengzhouense]MBI1621404.1 tripartite tricarboxylate transporter TctB family protein [Aquamicrobium zhengzhouense]